MTTTRDHWPLRGLRLRTPDLVLRPMVEADLDRVADELPADVGLDPSLPRFAGLDPAAARGAAVHQMYWRSLGTWSVETWRLPLVVLAADRVVGVQDLEAERFATTRTVDSSSHLVAAARGRGWGQQARRAILAFAFDVLGAERAISSAWVHNLASLGVSRALGYRRTHETTEPAEHGGGTDTMVHVELSRADWLASGQAASVRIEGADPCRPFFGLGPAPGR